MDNGGIGSRILTGLLMEGSSLSCHIGLVGPMPRDANTDGGSTVLSSLSSFALVWGKGDIDGNHSAWSSSIKIMFGAQVHSDDPTPQSWHGAFVYGRDFPK